MSKAGQAGRESCCNLIVRVCSPKNTGSRPSTPDLNASSLCVRIYIIFAKEEGLVIKTKQTILECLEHVRQHKTMSVEEFLLDDRDAVGYLPKARQLCAAGCADHSRCTTYRGTT